MKLKPIGNKLLVAYTSRQSGKRIYLTRTATRRPSSSARATVQGHELKPGTRVIVPETGLVEIRINRRPYYLVKESQLLGVLS